MTIFLLKMHNLNLIMKKNQTTQNVVYKISGCKLQRIKVMNVKLRLRLCSRQFKTWFTLEAFSIKNIVEKIFKSWIEFEDQVVKI